MSTAPSQVPDLFSRFPKLVEKANPRKMRGQVTEVVGTLVKAILPGGKVGELCELHRAGYSEPLLAEVVGFTSGGALIMPFGDFEGLSNTTEVVPTGKTHQVAVGHGLLGRVLDGFGHPLDGMPPIEPEAWYSVNAYPPDPMHRPIIDRPLPLGVRAIDSILTCGEGQRVGIFAAAGVGKSTLLAQILRNTEAEIVVLSLVGERGREVREFLDMVLTEETRKKAVVVVSTSDRPSMERLKCAQVATTIAEYFRDQGKKALLLVDSITRFARAQRMIGLAAGEPPTRRGFPPSVFSALPSLLERAGRTEKGSITALYTVLVEGDDMNEPVADETRSILDGHIILSRKLASAHHYPAIAVLESVSRVMNQIAEKDHIEAAGRLRDLMAKYEEAEMLIKIGEYKQGADAVTDEAIRKIDDIRGFLKQALMEYTSFDDTISRLIQIAGA